MPFYRCPRRLITKEIRWVFQHYFECARGDKVVYPNGKGRLFQTMRTIAVFDFIGKMTKKLEEKNNG